MTPASELTIRMRKGIAVVELHLNLSLPRLLNCNDLFTILFTKKLFFPNTAIIISNIINPDSLIIFS